MIKFKILVTRRESRSTEIEVYQESEDRNKAIDAASALSCDLDFNNLSVDDCVYTFDVIKVEEV